MASARKERPQAKPTAPRAPEPSPVSDHWILRVFDSTYRFLASVKLAVICIFTLAMVLAGATFFESGYGIPAVRQYVYQHPAFAILLAFLGTNIFCAATIRFPWKKRQIGFVVTHIGLLVILGGAFVSLRFSDEGQLGMVEGTKSSDLARIDHSMIVVQKYDRKAGDWGDSYSLPFDPGAFSWHSEELAKLAKDPTYQSRVWATRGAFGASLAVLLGFLYVWVVRRPAGLGVVQGSFLVSLLLAIAAGTGVMAAMTPSGPRRDVLTDPLDPFTLVAEDYLASSGVSEIRAEPTADGHPVAEIALLVTPPGETSAKDALDGQNWFEIGDGPFLRETRSGGPVGVVYQYAKGPTAALLVDDFLHPPKSPSTDKAARFHYCDKAGKTRVYEWPLNDVKDGATATLPDSDLTVTFGGIEDKSIAKAPSAATLFKATGESALHIARFEVRKGAAPAEMLGPISSLPAFPISQGELPEGLLGISFFYPPPLTARGGGMSGRLGQVEVLQAEGGKVYARAFGRDGVMFPPSPIEVGKTIKLNEGSKLPMKIALRVGAVEDRADVRRVFLHYEPTREERDAVIPAVQAAMTVKGVTRPISLLRTRTILPGRENWVRIDFPDANYRACFDFDHYSFPFSLTLKRFEPGRDPGSSNPATFRSDVTLSDAERGIRDEPEAIFMNNPLTHRGWTFYQSSFEKVDDPDTGQPKGAYASVFQVHYDPAWKIIYSGCLLVVIGIVLQFTMRAGLFSDGGRRESEQAQARFEKLVARSLASGAAPPASPTPAPPKTRTKRADDALEDL